MQVGGVGSSGGSGDGTVMADVLAGLGYRMGEGAVGWRAGWGGVRRGGPLVVGWVVARGGAACAHGRTCWVGHSGAWVRGPTLRERSRSQVGRAQ